MTASAGATLGELAEVLGAELRGDVQARVTHVAPLNLAGPGALTFLVDPKHAVAAQRSQATAVIVPPGVEQGGKGNFLLMANPYLGLARALEHLFPAVRPPVGVHERAVVDPGAEIGEGASIGAGASVADGARIGARTVVAEGVQVGIGVTVGEDAWLHPNVVLREGVRLGDRVVVQPGAVIGSDGFGYAPHEGGWVKIPQIGTVVVEDDVEIGANCAIDRATLGETRIGRGAKLDNLVQIAHNVVVGPDSAFAAQVGVAGSSQVGARVQLGGQAGVAGHIKIGDDVRVAAQSGVPGDVPAGETLAGTPTVPHRRWLRVKGAEARLPELRDRVRALEKTVRALVDTADEDVENR